MHNPNMNNIYKKSPEKMELIEQIKTDINNSDQTNWYCLTIFDNYEANFRGLFNSTRSLGSLTNRNFCRRYWDSGFHIKFTYSDKDVLLVFFQSKKDKLDQNTGFMRNLNVRYNLCSKDKAKDKLTLQYIKPLSGETVFELMNKMVEKTYDTNDKESIQKIRVVKFGSFRKNNSQQTTTIQ